MKSCQFKSLGLGAVAAGLFAMSAASHAATTTVLGNADLFNAAGANTYDGGNPVAINVTGIASFSISGATTSFLTYNGGGNYNDADGIGSASTMYSTGVPGLSGISAPNDGFLSGVFVGATLSGTTPAALSYTTTSFTQASPLLQQTFFIGDGLTGDGTGTTQTFFVPTGATTLYLGFIDACNYNGGPSCYSDNSGSVTFTLATVAAVPEPASVALMLAGLGGLGVAARRRRS